ncbi:hypothetical protein [Agrococcus casei]|uniref:tetratricopeptide repeat protein n=3 Tax=Agrococcus casei TaxID=343512 RepID=UPI003F8EC36B
MDEFVVGFDRTTLRPTLDLAKARARLAEIGQTRSMSSVLERAKLLAACGELEQAASLAAGAVVQARTSGLRVEALEARLVRASVAEARGQAERAIREATSIIDEARRGDFVEPWARALQLRGIAHFELEQWAEAVADFERALALRTDADAPRHLIDESEVSLLVATDRMGHAERRAARRRAVHPLFG